MPKDSATPSRKRPNTQVNRVIVAAVIAIGLVVVYYVSSPPAAHDTPGDISAVEDQPRPEVEHPEPVASDPETAAGDEEVTVADPPEEPTSDAEEGEPVELTEADFESEVLNSELPVLVDFWAPWCAPCRVVEPVLKELAQRYAGKAKVVRMNVDHNRGLSGKYHIQYIPTLIIIKQGKEVHRTVGAPPNIETELTAAIDDALSD